MPRLAATVHASCPVATPAAVQMPQRRCAASALRIVRAVSGPGTQITAAAIPRKAKNCVDTVQM